MKSVHQTVAVKFYFCPYFKSGKKSINDKNLKKTMEDEDKESEEEKDNDSYMKERSDIPSGTSKHLQKKAKKQAKKQAKVGNLEENYSFLILYLQLLSLKSE